MVRKALISKNEPERVINVHPKPLFIITNRKQLKAYNDPNLSKIIRILRTRPLTIKEITSNYNKANEPPKSEGSIYNYIKKLESVGLVITAGRKVPLFSTASEILYGTIAYVMFPMVLIERKYWETEESKQLIEVARQLISFHTGSEDPSHDDMKELFLKIYATSLLELSKFFDENKKAIDETFKDSSAGEIRRVVNLLSIVMVFRNPGNYTEELQKCFPDKKPSS
ncbi:MAG: hypothetical protein HeimAB125_06390 [Candidatus Heimdallarchaeota archaeon AB_125]|nr:MAG: hypothetical protein HeimAB125_06390 [Candidatus Heimdallarchaeota archaeon AB_125]